MPVHPGTDGNSPDAITVIVAVRNGEKFIADALSSIRLQTKQVSEVLVIDGNSTDRSAQIATAWGARVIQQKGRGLYDAWNEGLNQASGGIIAFLDSDDLWAPQSVELRFGVLHGDVGIAYGRVRHAFLQNVDVTELSWPRAAMAKDHLVAIPGTTLVRRWVFDLVGMFDTSMEIAADTDWLARALEVGIVFSSVDETVLVKRLHDNNLTRNGKQAKRELLQALRKKIAGKGKVSR
jgi:glycosyltransferase involved in cell wall biosynthesis